MTECIVCFEPIIQNNGQIIPAVAGLLTQKPLINGLANHVKCKNRSCTAVMCLDCMQSYINICMGDNQIPKCPSTTCGRYYLMSDVQRFHDLREPYAKCCLNELLGKHGDTARKTVEIRNNIETLRRLRQTFIAERFPRAIAYTASVIMPHKLRRLDKQVTERIQAQTLNTNRTCMNLTCNGSLNEFMVCLSCDTAFCIDCEKRRNANHVCDPADVESVKAIKEMIHCPNCHLPIIRSEGCNNMTCSSCGQHFLYNTGEAGGAGGHVTKTEIPKTKMLLSTTHQQVLIELGLMGLIAEIEALEPKTTDDKVLTNILINYYKNNQVSTPQLEIELAVSFERHIIRIYTNKRYHQALNEIESRIIARTVSAAYLLQILAILRQPF